MFHRRSEYADLFVHPNYDIYLLSFYFSLKETIAFPRTLNKICYYTIDHILLFSYVVGYMPLSCLTYTFI